MHSYRLIIGYKDNIGNFIGEINEHLMDGFIAQGGICVVIEPDGTTKLFQAVVKI